MQQEPDEEQGERDHPDEQREEHEPVDVDIEVGVEDGGLLVQAAPQTNTPVDQGDLDDSAQADPRAATGSALPGAV